jgi:hypothetical protein
MQNSERKEETIMKARNEPSLDTGLTMVCRQLLLLAALSYVLGLIAGATAYAAQGSVTTTQVTTTTVSQPAVGDPSVWIGRNISAVVDAYGQPSYWNASHDGGGGGGRYIFDNPNQPHFVFETQPGGIIVRASKVR